MTASTLSFNIPDLITQPLRNVFLKDNFGCTDTFLTSDLGHLKKPHSVHTSSQIRSWGTIFDFLETFLGTSTTSICSHILSEIHSWNSHILSETCTWKTMLDCLNTCLAWVLGHFNNANLFTTFQKFPLEGQFLTASTLSWLPILGTSTTTICSHILSDIRSWTTIFYCLDTFLAWALGHFNTPESVHTSSQNWLLRDNCDSLDTVLARDLGHVNNPNLFTHPVKNWLLRDNCDSLDTVLARDLGHVNNPNLFTHPLQNLPHRDIFLNCLDTVLPFGNSLLKDNFLTASTLKILGTSRTSFCLHILS